MKNYTVSQLAKLSGVTVRSLHFYDDIGLLKPSFTAENGYRYYQEKQLLILQQILFFRELGFELKQIQEIVSASDFDQLTALQAHKDELRKKIERMQTLMTTIDKTINHLQGAQTMSEKELFFGLQNYSPELQELMRNCMHNNPGMQKFTDQMFQAQKDWTEQDKEKVRQETHALWQNLTHAFNKKLKTDATKVQELIRKYDQLLKRFGLTHDQTQFIAMAEHMPKVVESHKKALALYPELQDAYTKTKSDEQFEMLEKNPGFAEFMADAMKLYAERNLVKSEKSLYQSLDWSEEKKKQEKDIAVWHELAKEFNKGHKVGSSHVQLIMEQYRQLLKTQRGIAYKPELFLQMAEYTPTMLEHHKKLTAQHPELAHMLQAGDQVFYDNPGLLEFLADAMKEYAKRNQ